MSWQDQGSSDGEDNNRRPNPWGKPEQKPQMPWGSRKSSSRGDGPDLEDLIRRAQDGFQGFSGGTGKMLAIGVLVAVVLWLASGLYFIQPNQNGVVLTFGKYAHTDEVPGLKWRLPWPIQSVNVIDVTAERRIQIGYGESGRRGQPDLPDESLMLTGDENIIDIDFVVLWRINNAKDFLYSIRDPEDTIRLVAASAMREVIGKTKIQSALTEGRNQIQTDTRALMQKTLDDYKSGVTINNVQLQKVDPPSAVVDAFNEVQRARQRREELRNLAEAYRNDIMPKAVGESEKLRQQADGYRQEVVNRAKGDADRFNSVLEAYKGAPSVTARRMYLETMEDVLKNANTIVMGSGAAGNVLPYLSLDKVQKSPKLGEIPQAAVGEAKP